MWSIVSADANFDPFPQFLYLGDSIEDGLFAWIQIGINGSADYTDDDYYSIGMFCPLFPSYTYVITPGCTTRGTGAFPLPNPLVPVNV